MGEIMTKYNGSQCVAGAPHFHETTTPVRMHVCTPLVFTTTPAASHLSATSIAKFMFSVQTLEPSP